MDEPVQLHDLTDGANAYEMLPAPKNCDALTEPSRDGNGPAEQSERVDFSKPKPETGTVAFRIVQIFCGLLLLMVIINSVAIGVLIQKLNSRMSEIEVDSKSTTQALKAIQQNGPPGTKGEQGLRGMKGDSGNPGTAGPKGDSGEKGLDGQKGEKGLTGTKGDTGALGPTGPQGPPGTKREQGLRGMKGDSNNPGTAGPKGDSGEKGLDGQKGEKGSTGTKGDTGAFGPTGPQGPPGINGLHGLRGMKGDSGNPGTPGPKGDSGDKGLDGQKGERGFTGYRGNPGTAGLKGDSGEKGDVGQKGQRGPAGLDAQKEYKSAFAIYGDEPIQGSSGVMTVPSYGVVTNIGQHFSPATGQYTAQYPGIYVFLLNIYKERTSSSVTCYIRRNRNSVAIASVAITDSGYHESSAATLLHLSRGDKVDVNCDSVDNLDSWTSFIGFLLKAD